MAKAQMLICPYCGEAQPLSERCRACRGFFEPLSRQATHNSMGPWFIRDVKRPHRPGCSYETLVRLIERGLVDRFSIIRGPTTRQFWAVAKRVPGVAHLLGYCHNCDAHVEPTHHGCPKCGVPFGAYINRNYLGLPDIRPLPWEAELDLSDRSQVSGNGADHGGSATEMTHTQSSAAPRNVGISSFATDEELTSTPAPAVTATSTAGIANRGGASRTATGGADEPEFIDVPGEEPGLREEAKAIAQAPEPGAVAGPRAVDGRGDPIPRADDRTTRSLRTMVMRQQRTIRVLSFVLAGIALLSGVLGIALARALAAKEPQTPATQHADDSATSPKGSTVDDEQRNAAARTGGAAAPNERDEASPTQKDADATDAPAAAPADESKAAIIAEVLKKVDEARALLEAAADDARPLDDRIADAEQAVTLLETAEKDAPPGALPADFGDVLHDARTTRERLRLSKFFP